MQTAPGNPASKICRKCGVSKPTDQFYKPNQNTCKRCHLLRCKDWAIKNKPKVAVIKHRYLLNNPASRKESLAKWHLKRRSIRPWETTYFAAMQRTQNPKHKHYKYYGGKGVQLKMSVVDFEFLWKRDNADSMSKPSIDRIDSSGHYAVNNCRFIEMAENSRRQRRLKEDQVIDIRNRYQSGIFSQREIAVKYNIEPSAVSRIWTRKEYADIK